MNFGFVAQKNAVLVGPERNPGESQAVEGQRGRSKKVYSLLHAGHFNTTTSSSSHCKLILVPQESQRRQAAFATLSGSELRKPQQAV